MNQLFYAVNVYIYNNRMLLRVIMKHSYEKCVTIQQPVYKLYALHVIECWAC